MPSYAVWKSRPVFVTSTFRDMQEERDYLREHVFPVLEERLKERFHHLEWVDLRWGVERPSADEQESRELLVLKVCLGEIERSRPFLIGLIGDRYGWVPPEERMRAAAEEAGFTADVAGKSITSLEIEYGVLESADQKRRSWFYFREPLPYDDMPPETAAVYSDLHSGEPGARDAHERLQSLKKRIERQLPNRVRAYSAGWDGEKVVGLKEWGERVLEDLWSDLEAETSDFERQVSAQWQDQENAVLDQFIETQCRDFVGREETVEHLRRFALSPDQDGEGWCVSVTGPSGSGKSSLFAKMHRVLREEDALILAHSAGISARSAPG